MLLCKESRRHRAERRLRCGPAFCIMFSRHKFRIVLHRTALAPVFYDAFILIWSPHGDEELPWTTLIIRLYWPTQDPDIKDTHWIPTTIKDDTWIHVSSVITIHPNDGSNRLEKYTVSLLVGSVKDTIIQFLDWTSQHLNLHVQYFDMNTFWSLVFAFTRLFFSTGCRFSTDAQSNVLLHFIQASKK